MVGDRCPRNWRWRVENTLAGRPQFEADKDWDEVERPSPGLGDHPRILPTVLLMTDSGRETEEQVEKGAHYPIKLSYSCQCKGRMKKKLWRNLGVSPIS